MVRVLLYGLGPIGVMVARQLATRDGFRIVGAVDVDPQRWGATWPRSPASAAASRESRARTRGTPSRKSKPDIVVLCTSSSLRGVMPQIEGVLKAKVPIVTTTEELSYPGEAQRCAGEDDRRAWRRGRKSRCLSTGVNPGFVMDALPIMLTVACERVESVAVTRVQDASRRRLPFQQKIGAGLSPEQFEREVDAGIDSARRPRGVDLDDCRTRSAGSSIASPTK